MSDVVLRTVTRSQVAVYSARHRLGVLARRVARRLEDQTGQDLIEYAGVLAIIALIIGAIFATGFWNTVRDAVTNTINSILNGHGSTSTK
jgi:Flp pilus assembly pilin Flp